MGARYLSHSPVNRMIILSHQQACPCAGTLACRGSSWQDFAALAKIQLALLERCLAVLKPGGRIVYSTCSLETAENEAVLEAFLARHPEWTGEVAYRVWPGAAADGGFALAWVHRP